MNHAEPTVIPMAPEMPTHLDADAQLAWEWLCGQLQSMGLLATSDVAVMTVYCDSWSGYRRARAGVLKYGPVLVSEKTKVPFLSAYTSAEAMYRKALMGAAVELGLTPSARSRVHAMLEPPEKEGKRKYFGVVG